MNSHLSYNKFDEIEKELHLGHYELGWDTSSFGREGILKSMKANYTQEKLLLKDLEDILKAQYELRAQYSIESLKMKTPSSLYCQYLKKIFFLIIFFLNLICIISKNRSHQKDKLKYISINEYNQIINYFMYSLIVFQFYFNFILHFFFPLAMEVKNQFYNKLVRFFYISYIVSIDIFGCSCLYIFIRFINFDTKDLREIYIMIFAFLYFILTVFLSKITLFYCNFHFVLTPLAYAIHYFITKFVTFFFLIIFFPYEVRKKSLILSNILSYKFYIQLQINFIEVQVLGDSFDEKFHINANHFQTENKDLNDFHSMNELENSNTLMQELLSQYNSQDEIKESFSQEEIEERV